MDSFKNRIASFWEANKKSKLFWSIAAVIIIIILVIVFHKKTVLVDAGVAVATKTNVVDSVVLSGRTRSASAVDLGFADQGRVATVAVSEGQKVSAGQILASLDTSDLNASLKNAQAALVIARAGLSNTTTSLDKITQQQDTLVNNAYRNLLSDGLSAASANLGTGQSLAAPVITGTYTGDEGSYNISVYASNSSSGSSWTTTGLENSVGEVSTNTPIPLGTHGLYISFPNTGSLYAGTKWVVEIPNKRSANYAVNYSAYTAAVSARDLAISNAKSDLSQDGTDNSVAQARVQQAQAQVDSILSQINRRRIVAPFDGVVANVNVKPGQTTTSITSSSNSTTTGTTGSTITLISENDYEVVLDVPEMSVAKLSVGQAVNITLDAYGSDVVFPGKVSSIDPAETIVSGVPVYETKVVFTNSDNRIRSGMTATATIVAASKSDVIAIPAKFIFKDSDGSSYVYVMISDDKTEKRSVVTGVRGSDSSTEIISGLAEGDQVNMEILK